MDRKIISTENAPSAIGYYSQAIISNGIIYTAGQIPLDPSSGEVVSADFIEQAKQVFKNLEAVLTEAGSSVKQSIKFNVYLTDMSNYNDLNKVFKERFAGVAPPARSVVEVSRLPKDVLIEIDCIAKV